MDRRAFLATGLLALGGCAGTDTGGDENDRRQADRRDDEGPPRPRETRQRGTPGETISVPDDSPMSKFETTTTEGVAVPLAPLETAYEWHQNDAARFVDARSKSQYERSHIEGAVLSPAPKGPRNGPDPVAEWSKDTHIVAYCGCPHHLSSLRAATMIENGYENVAVIDEGFWAWHEKGYPMAGTNVESEPKSYEIRGRDPAAPSGESAWAFHDPTGQREAAPVAADGSYHLELKFDDVSADSTIRVSAPTYEREGRLADLTSGVVTPP